MQLLLEKSQDLFSQFIGVFSSVTSTRSSAIERYVFANDSLTAVVASFVVSAVYSQSTGPRLLKSAITARSSDLHLGQMLDTVVDKQQSLLGLFDAVHSHGSDLI